MANRLETWGNQNTMNLDTILHTNILSCAYFRELLYEVFYFEYSWDWSRLKSYNEIVDEIYSEVSSLGASSKN